MTDLSLKLSAYLDGELAPTDALEIEARLERDPVAQAELEALVEAQMLAQEQFNAQLNHPPQLSLLKQMKEASPESKPATSRPVWGVLAASIVALIIGSAGGYLFKDHMARQQNPGWLAAIADYHAVYASQERHLVEVGADEAEHIETWLGATIGVAFTIPELTEFGLVFEGGRLLVANGKPVAQLMYRQEDGTVIALCLQRGSSNTNGVPVFNARTIKGFDFVSWKTPGVDYVVIGPEGQPALEGIAALAAIEI